MGGGEGDPTIGRFGSKEKLYQGSGKGGCLRLVAGWRWDFSPGFLLWEVDAAESLELGA